jgi:hypothetical protein
MRFVSRYGRYGIQLRPQIQEAYATGMAKIIQEAIWANFSPDILTHIDREIAMQTWAHWNGAYQEMDEVSVIPPDYRIGVFDSDEAAIREGWSEETHAWVDEQLTDFANRYADIAIVPKTLLDPPWPKYDTYKGSISALMRKLVDEGFDLEKVLEYEHAVQGRGKVVEALQNLISDPEAREALEPEREEEEVVA